MKEYYYYFMIIIIIIIIHPLELFTSAIADGFSLKSEWQQVSSSLQDSSCQNTKKSPGDLRRLAVTQTSVKNYRLLLMWKALMNE